MIAVVKRWLAVFCALLFYFPVSATAADDVGGAARELARKTAAFAGKGAAVAVTWRKNSLPDAAAAQARGSFESALQEAGLRVSEISPAAELRITVSENLSQFLLVEEAVKGDDRQVFIASWKRTDVVSAPTPGVALEKKLLWEQDEPILDVAFPAAGMLVLSASNVTLYTHAGSQWEPQRAAPLESKTWPKDMRGRLRLKGTGFQVLLPGVQCEGVSDPALTLDCHASEEAWVLESGSRALLLANFAATRNYFDGRVTTQAGQRKTVATFFSAASVESQGRTLWLLATLDGKIQILDAALEPAGVSTAAWGSDIAGTDAHCGTGSQVLATRPGDRGQSDSVQAYTIVDRSPEPLTDAAEFPGPVLALWTSGGNGVTVVVRDLRSGKYAAYALTVVCRG
jgi:hypothetical protein